MSINSSSGLVAGGPGLLPLELWGGLECSVARIHDQFRNQIMETGHHDRPDDLERIAALGLRTLRYPVLLETISPTHPDQQEWAWHDERLTRLQALGISPIAGLVHHGSGPAYTSLVDPAFPEIVARHAARVARRYPWITHYTPINEPLTTARFSGLYGHWYPHGREMGVFLRTLVNQCRAVVLAMQAIRRVNPAARLVQTEDLGKAFGTPPMQYQADYENERRWLSFDLLCGRLDRQHPWHATFLKAGIGERELAFFVESACVPDIVGINHYLTSERFLDHRLAMYPGFHQNTGASHTYVDVEAVRVELPASQIGPEARLREAWERYRLPMAVTEAHHGCSRDEQLRWLMEVWQAAQQLRTEGADVRAVTVWSLLGAVDWNSLLQHQHGFYEPGVFDVRASPPRPTVLAAATAALATTGAFDHPVLDRVGWWKRDERFYRPPSRSARLRVVGSPRRLLITGASGTLGQAFSRICHLRGLDHHLLSRRELDIADGASIDAALQACQPWAVINTAGYVRVADAEREAQRCFRENTEGAALLAEACARQGIAYVTFSSDLVFNGALGRPYLESDAVDPQGIYGRSKAQAEPRILAAHPQALVIRSSAFFGPWDLYNFAYATLHALARGRRLQAAAAAAVAVSPTYVPDLVHAALDLLIDGASGIWHLANRGHVSWHGFALMLAEAAGLDAEALAVDDEGAPPAMTVLTSERGMVMPTLAHGIDRYLHDSHDHWRMAAGKA
ncbi:MAG: sugar nucleotide-binding protein [Pseudomonadota bacterium]|nr:sugar nucleotide-binding protein [Pseudomonadota bacterium]